MSDSVGSVSVDVVPDARGWAEKLRAQIHDATVKVKADAETGEAAAELDELARDRTANIKVDVDKSALSRLDQFMGDMSALPAIAIAAGSALIPVAATLGGIAVALAAPLAIAGGGATLFAFLGGLAAKDTEAKLKAIDKLRQHLQTLTKGTAEYATAQRQLKDAEAALTPEQRKFAAAQDSLTGAFQKFLQGNAGKTLLDVMAQGMTVLAHLLPAVAPIITTVGKAISSLLSEVSRAAQSRGFGHFVDQFARLAGRDITIGAHILGELAKGVGSLLLATDKGFSGGFLRGLDHLSSSFADWASSRQARHEMRDFFDYVHRVGPQVAGTIAAMARALGKVVAALAPLGPVVLKGVQLAADSLGAIPIPVLTALAAAFVSLVGFQKLGGFKALSALGRLGGGSVGGSAISRIIGGGVQKVYVVNMGGPGGLGGGSIEGEGKLFGRFALSELLAGAAQFGLLAAAAYFDYRATKTIVHQVATSESKFAFGQALPTNGGPVGPKTSAAAQRQQSQLFWMDGGGRASLSATTTALDTVRARAAAASRQIDMVGPHAAAAFGQADKAVDTFRSKLAAIHDKQIQVILQDQAAVNQLEAIQRMRIADKNFNIYAHYQQIERAVGPGGGAGQNPHGSGGGGGGGGGGGAGLTVHVHGHIDENGYVSGTAQRVYDDNQRFASAHG